MIPIVIEPSISHLERHEARDLAKLYRDVGLLTGQEETAFLRKLCDSHIELRKAFRHAIKRAQGYASLDGPWPIVVRLTNDVKPVENWAQAPRKSCQGSIDSVLSTCLDNWQYELLEGSLEDRDAFWTATVKPLVSIALQVTIIDNYFYPDFERGKDSGARWILEKLLEPSRENNLERIIVCSAIPPEELEIDGAGFESRVKNRVNSWYQELSGRFAEQVRASLKFYLVRQDEAAKAYHDRAYCFKFPEEDIVLKLSTSASIFNEGSIFKGEDWSRKMKATIIQPAIDALSTFKGKCSDGQGIEVAPLP